MLKVDRRCKPCKWNDILFASVTDCAAYNKISINEQIRRFNLGYACDEDMKVDMRHLRLQPYFTPERQANDPDA